MHIWQTWPEASNTRVITLISQYGRQIQFNPRFGGAYPIPTKILCIQFWNQWHIKRSMLEDGLLVAFRSFRLVVCVEASMSALVLELNVPPALNTKGYGRARVSETPGCPIGRGVYEAKKTKYMSKENFEFIPFFPIVALRPWASLMPVSLPICGRYSSNSGHSSTASPLSS